jgi:hypothetical protein
LRPYGDPLAAFEYSIVEDYTQPSGVFLLWFGCWLPRSQREVCLGRRPTLSHRGVPALYDTVCRTLDNDESVQFIRHMMRNFEGMFIPIPDAWGTIVWAVVEQCPQHAESFRNYARFYGNY